jgi:hypothetical protein
MHVKGLALDDEDVAGLQEGVDRIQNAHEYVQALIAQLSSTQSDATGSNAYPGAVRGATPGGGYSGKA